MSTGGYTGIFVDSLIRKPRIAAGQMGSQITWGVAQPKRHHFEFVYSPSVVLKLFSRETLSTASSTCQYPLARFRVENNCDCDSQWRP